MSNTGERPASGQNMRSNLEDLNQETDCAYGIRREGRIAQAEYVEPRWRAGCSRGMEAWPAKDHPWVGVLPFIGLSTPGDPPIRTGSKSIRGRWSRQRWALQGPNSSNIRQGKPECLPSHGRLEMARWKSTVSTIQDKILRLVYRLPPMLHYRHFPIFRS